MAVEKRAKGEESEKASTAETAIRPAAIMERIVVDYRAAPERFDDGFRVMEVACRPELIRRAG